MKMNKLLPVALSGRRGKEKKFKNINSTILTLLRNIINKNTYTQTHFPAQKLNKNFF
jgi:hypothetical protein